MIEVSARYKIEAGDRAGAGRRDRQPGPERLQERRP